MRLGIIKGVEESEEALSFAESILRALNRRFRSKIEFSILPMGNCEVFGGELSDEALKELGKCDVLLSGETDSDESAVNYTFDDILVRLSCDYEILFIKNAKENREIQIISYYGGGFYNGAENEDRFEKRLFSSRKAAEPAARLCRESCGRGRRILLIKDSENEFYFEMFVSRVKNAAIPYENFFIETVSARQFFASFESMFYNFDTIFASKTTSDAIYGVSRALLGEDFIRCSVYKGEKTLYKLSTENEKCGAALIKSCAEALAKLLENELLMKKEAFALRLAVSDASFDSAATLEPEQYMEKIKLLLNRRLTTRFAKPTCRR